MRFYDVMKELDDAKFNPIQRLIKIAKNENGTFEDSASVKATITLVDKTTQTYKSTEHRIDEEQHAQIVASLSTVMNPLLEEHKKDY